MVAGELERQEWELAKGKIALGRQLLKAYRRRCSDKEAMNYHANREHHHRRHTSALVAARKFVEMNMCMADAATAHQFQQQLQSFVQRVAGMARLPESDVLVVPWINFAAPPCILHCRRR